MTDFVTRLARKWCPYHVRLDGRLESAAQECACWAILAACREVLEEVNKEWVNRLSVYNADKAIPLEGIAAALQQRGGGMSLTTHDHGNCEACDLNDTEITRLHAERDAALAQVEELIQILTDLPAGRHYQNIIQRARGLVYGSQR